MKKVIRDGKTYYISTYTQGFEDGERIISVGCYVSNIGMIDYRRTVGHVAHSIKSPRDEYSENLEVEIITGRLRKKSATSKVLFEFSIQKELKSRHLIETILDNYAKNLVRELSKKYKIIRE